MDNNKTTTKEVCYGREDLLHTAEKMAGEFGNPEAGEELCGVMADAAAAYLARIRRKKNDGPRTFGITLDLSKADTIHSDTDDGYVDFTVTAENGSLPFVLSCYDKTDEQSKDIDGLDGQFLMQEEFILSADGIQRTSTTIPASSGIDEMVHQIKDLKENLRKALYAEVAELLDRLHCSRLDFSALLDDDIIGDDANDNRICIDRWDRHDMWYKQNPYAIHRDKDGTLYAECDDYSEGTCRETIPLDDITISALADLHTILRDYIIAVPDAILRPSKDFSDSLSLIIEEADGTDAEESPEMKLMHRLHDAGVFSVNVVNRPDKPLVFTYDDDGTVHETQTITDIATEKEFVLICKGNLGVVVLTPGNLHDEEKQKVLDYLQEYMDSTDELRTLFKELEEFTGKDVPEDKLKAVIERICTSFSENIRPTERYNLEDNGLSFVSRDRSGLENGHNTCQSLFTVTCSKTDLPGILHVEQVITRL